MIKNRTIFTGDNLPVLRGMDSRSVDLIYLDPPFNSNRHYSAPIGSQAAGAEFKDAWTFEDTDAAWWGELADNRESLYRVIDAAGAVGGKGDKAYLIYMAMRLLELHRILKPTGSIYFHCDPTMSHPVKMMLDAILGKKNFKNEIVWHYRRWTAGTKNFQRMHDIIFRYVKSNKFIFNVQYEPYGDWINRDYKHIDEKTGKRWRWHTVKGKRYKVFLEDENRGVKLNDVWAMPHLGSTAEERVGYPTQKPKALLARIIKASSNKGDVILDPFCGCATTCIAAEMLGREWIGVDISPKAAELVKTRSVKEIGGLFPIIHREDIPSRDAPPPSTNIKHILFGNQEGLCNGCKVQFPYSNFTIDHIVPTAKGGQDADDNLQLLCNYCNSVKGDRTMQYLLSRLTEQ